jgi:hypothetical protein
MAREMQFAITSVSALGPSERVAERLAEAKIEDLEARTEERGLKAADESYRVRAEVDRKRERQQADIRARYFLMCLIALLVIADVVSVFRDRDYGLLERRLFPGIGLLASVGAGFGLHWLVRMSCSGSDEGEQDPRKRL